MEYKPVVTAFLRSEELILLLRRSSKVGTYKGKWAAVSGFLEGDEDPLERAETEIAEEVGLTQQDIAAFSQEQSTLSSTRASPGSSSQGSAPGGPGIAAGGPPLDAGGGFPLDGGAPAGLSSISTQSTTVSGSQTSSGAGSTWLIQQVIKLLEGKIQN